MMSAMKRAIAVFAALSGLALFAMAQPPKPGAHAAKPAVARVQLLPGVWADWERGVVEASGSYAADLYAPSADIARIKTERMARLSAKDRLRKALALLGRDEKLRPHLAPFGGFEKVAQLDVEQAKVVSLDESSSGSIALRLSLSLRTAAPADLGATPADGGADPGAEKGSGG